MSESRPTDSVRQPNRPPRSGEGAAGAGDGAPPAGQAAPASPASPAGQTGQAGQAPPQTGGGDEGDLSQLRAEIDAIDREILASLNRRAERVCAIGEIKRRSGGSVYRAARERDLVAALCEENTGPFPSGALPAVFREIISSTYALEEPLRIAYLGPAGTFSHLAARRAFGSQAAYEPAVTMKDVIAAVERGVCQHGVLPVENTSEGPVTQTLDALLETRLPICGERLLRISQNLLAQCSSLAEVERVASHPQPLAQCRAWLDRNLPEAPRLETASTAAAAEMARREPGTAAIGAEILAEEGPLEILAADIEDNRDNTTRFLLIGGEPPPVSGADLTTIAYTVRKGESGALFRLLEPFAASGVNLTAIHARPLRGAPWEYVFFIDLEGHQSETRVQQACAEAGKLANSWRVLGSFPRAGKQREVFAR